MKLKKRLLALLLSVLMLLGLFPVTVLADASDDVLATIIAGSDLQSYNDNGYNASDPAIIKSIIDRMNITSADAFLFAGDYGVSDTATHLRNLKSAVSSWKLGFQQEVYLQGNHDDDLIGNGMTPSGPSDPTGALAGKYGVFVINHKDYPEYPISSGSDPNGRKTLAAASSLQAYLNGKLAVDFKKPIFVVSHLGLHYSSRTIVRGDGAYASYIFDVLNDAAADGLNIIFLYGHNHSGGWDDFIGGSSVYLKPGDKINIAQGSQVYYKEETLNFTYMNPGYVGYYTAEGSSCDTTLTATKFDIYEDEVVINRYDAANGTHNLKSAGSRSAVDRQYNVRFAVDETVYQSPQAVTLEAPPPRPVFNPGEIGQTTEVVDGDWVEVQSYNPGGTSYILDTNGVDTGEKYLIVAPTNNYAGNSYAMYMNNYDTVASQSVTFSNNNTTATISANENNALWTITRSGSNYTVFNEARSRYLELSIVSKNNADMTFNTDSRMVSIGNDNGSGQYDIHSTNSIKDGGIRYGYLWYNGGFGPVAAKQNSPQYIRLYKQVISDPTPALYAKMRGQVGYEYKVGAMTAEQIDAAVRAGITVYTNSSASDEGATEITNYTLTGSGVQPDTVGDYTYTVEYNNVSLGEITVSIVPASIVNVALASQEGWVRHGAASGTVIRNTSIVVSYDDGTTETFPVTVSMLSGDFDVTVDGEYSGLTVTYGEHTFENFTLTVAEADNYPEYPNEGSVRVDKKSDNREVNFQETGVTQIHLSATGVPAQTGVDLMIVVDTSSSMNYNVAVNTTRMDALRSSLRNMLDTLKLPNENGTLKDIQVAIAQFNGNTLGNLRNTLVIRGTSACNDQPNTNNQVVLPFTDINTENFNVNSLVALNGTNYDAAMQMAYDTLALKKETNEAAGDLREQFVIFLTDGGPYQYNYMGQSSNSTSAANWTHWLIGDEIGYNAIPSGYEYLFNGDTTNFDEINHQHMAQAIKGDPNTQYKVYVPHTTNGTTRIDEERRFGLGAKIYSIGFGTDNDSVWEYDKVFFINDHNCVPDILSDISSGEGYFIEANDENSLTAAFSNIASQIRLAGTNAVFTDKMSAYFSLQTASTVIRNGETINVHPDGNGNALPMTIEVKTYAVYKTSDVGKTINGVPVTSDMVGNPKIPVQPKSTLEIVTFSADGTTATSTALPNVSNIIYDNKINARYFSYDFATETFTWNIGDITEDDIALSYYAYLDGSMEGERGAGSYPTNAFATLTYTNYLGNPATKETVSPVLPWESASVRYAFYLVNSDGNPIVNQSTGATGSFQNSVKVTQPVTYQEVLLNSSEAVQVTAVAGEAVPVGYALFDAVASYSVTISSGASGSSWTINKGENLIRTTYVEGHDGIHVSTELNQTGPYDYTHTTVWFAVQYEASATPDAVVIDFGLPVDINVTANDQVLSRDGRLVSVSTAVLTETSEHTTALKTGYATSISLNHGTATVQTNGKVRYTPNAGDMQMAQTEVFSYAAQYVGDTSTFDGYYYSNVKVIPAANIYYEDSFATFNDGANGAAWVQEGTTAENAIQSEDRPGQFSLTEYDANNVYGYDPAYNNFSTYSLGSARKVTVSAADAPSWPTATFTFCGTGFDIIGLTSNTTGTIRVQVMQGQTQVKSLIVDTYYGYKLNEQGAWTVDPEATDTLYQIPVMKVEGLDYGTYNAIITPMYATPFDHQKTGSYDFYLDAIRIYDPTGGLDETAADAYRDDKESNPEYAELRNLLIDAGSFNTGSTAVNGIVFIDGNATLEDMSTYTQAGPNNEVYLACGQSIAFTLASNYKPASVQMGIKLVDGTSADVTAKNLNEPRQETKTIATATDMFYSIDSYITWVEQPNGTWVSAQPIIITNTTQNSVVSLTNIKWTGAPDANAPVLMNLFADYAVAEAAYFSVRDMLNIHEAFAPEVFEISLKNNTINANKKAEFIIETSADVASVTVNGQSAQLDKTNRRTGITTWKYSEQLDKAGEYTFEAVAYDAQGIASEPKKITLTVNEGKKNKLEAFISSIFDWIWRS